MRRQVVKPRSRARDDRGSSLVLALVFLLVGSIIVVALGDFAVGAATNSSTTQKERLIELNAQSVATIAAQQMRTSFNYPGQADSTLAYSNHTPTVCLPSSVSIDNLTAVCEGWQSGPIRNVYFQVCSTTASNYSVTNCASGSGVTPVLSAEVSYDDVPTATPTPPDTCTASTTGSCGVTMAIDFWDVRNSDS